MPKSCQKYHLNIVRDFNLSHQLEPVLTTESIKWKMASQIYASFKIDKIWATNKTTEITENTEIFLLSVFSVISVVLFVAQILTSVFCSGNRLDQHPSPGLLESAYELCLMYELRLRRLNVEHQKPLPIFYKDVILDCGYRLDIVVENQVIVEIKAVSGIAPIHEAQLLSYLKMSDYKRGLLINFNVTMLKDGLRRMRL